MASLLILRGPNQGQRLPINADKIALGRDPDCQVVIAGSAVSREHAYIIRVQGKFFIEDNQSRNGTFVNNQQVTGRTLLKDNDRIKICDFLCTFLQEASTPKPLPADLQPDPPEEEEPAGQSTYELLHTVAGGGFGKVYRAQESYVNADRGMAAVPAPTPYTRWSDVQLPRESAVGVPVALLVRVTIAPVSGEAKPLELHAAAGERVIEVTVLARPNGLELKGSNLRKLRVPLAADSDPVHFELLGTQVGPASVTVDFFQQERYLGSVTAQTFVKEAGAVVHGSPAPTRGRLDFSEQWPAPDLLVRIYQARGPAGEPRYRFELTSAKLGLFCKDAGESGLPLQPQAWVERQMHDLNRLARGLRKETDKVLARYGVDLHDRLCPPELQKLYWEELHERDDIQSVLVVSDEPWVSWEMLKPWRPVGKRNVEAPHWCERFVLGRWLAGQPPPTVLPRGPVAAIAPSDVDLGTEAEVQMLQKLGLPVRRVPARLNAVLDFLASDGCPGLHIASHGEFDLDDADQAELWLEKPFVNKEREVLRPRFVNGACLNFGQARPLVFVNACTAGRTDFNYWGLGGWARAFVERARCGAFIGPFWDVQVERAVQFAEVFYDLLLNGKPLGEAVRTARLDLKRADNPTWLAYGLYGHPNASL